MQEDGTLLDDAMLHQKAAAVPEIPVLLSEVESSDSGLVQRAGGEPTEHVNDVVRLEQAIAKIQ